MSGVSVMSSQHQTFVYIVTTFCATNIRHGHSPDLITFTPASSLSFSCRIFFLPWNAQFSFRFPYKQELKCMRDKKATAGLILALRNKRCGNGKSLVYLWDQSGKSCHYRQTANAMLVPVYHFTDYILYINIDIYFVMTNTKIKLFVSMPLAVA